MSAFDSIGDSAHSLRTEGQEIKLSFKQGFPTTGQGTIEWNIPAPAHGCVNGEDGVYAGIVFLLSTEPLDASNIPQDGTVYVADPTANFDLSTADRIGNAIVVGAVYECNKKGKGETLTTSLIINDLEQGASYYVGGYALDCQNRYHADGIRSYSDSYGEKDGASTSSLQVVNLGPESTGIVPTDGTGLIPGVNYEFDLIVDESFPTGFDFVTMQINIDGIDAGTYQDLLDSIKSQILLSTNPPQSPIAPNTNDFYWNTSEQKLYQYDGADHNLIASMVEPTDPAAIGMGTYWYNPTSKILQRNNIPAPTGWNIIAFLKSESDPSNPSCDLYWYDGTTARKWDGSTWCNQTTVISTTDPTVCPTVECGTYWYDENTSSLFGWDTIDARWESKIAIYWSEALNQLSTGTYWFDDTNSKLFIRAASTWTDTTSSTKIQETTPTTLVDGLLWYKKSTEELKQYDTGTTSWVLLDVLVWQVDPTAVDSCDLWWNSTNDVMSIWDVVNSEWDSVVRFVSSTLNPTLPSPLVVDTIWYEPTSSAMKRFDGGDFVLVEHVEKSTDPTQISIGQGWYKASTNTWNMWDTPASGWNVINPIDSDVDPNSIPNGTYWFDTTSTALFVRNGVSWISVTFSTVPYVPARKSLWYDTSIAILKTWNGTAWVTTTSNVDVFFNTSGGITFSTIKKGSNTAILVPSPPGSVSEPNIVGTGFADFSEFDIDPVTQYTFERGKDGRVYQARYIPDSSFLWSNLSNPGKIRTPTAGNDGKSGVPSYAELGVGDDGTPDERRELMDSIRAQLGYPVVEVELTNYQLDTAITGAIESFRKRAGSAYRRGFYFLNIEPGKQQYIMTNKAMGYNKIVTITSAHRFTSAFLSSAHGSGVYGQVVLQHLYNMGTFDLTSFHLVSQYVEQLEHLFSTRLTFTFHENDRVLSFFNSFTRPERVLIDCMVERTEQDLLKDRYIKTWIERYALSEAMMMLSHIRGKFASLPGAGGGIALNAGELISLAQSYREELLLQIDEFIVDQPEDIGQYSTFILG